MADFLTGLGRLEQQARAATNLASPMDNYLADAGDLFVKIMIDKIKTNGSYVKGDLAQGLIAIPSVDSRGHSIEFFGDVNYTEWQNDGVSGTQQQRDTIYAFKGEKPHPDMVKWNKSGYYEGSIPEWMNNKKIDTEIFSAYAIAVNILRNGFDGIRFKEAAFKQENLDSFENALLSLVAANVDGKITRIIPNFK